MTAPPPHPTFAVGRAVAVTAGVTALLLAIAWGITPLFGVHSDRARDTALVCASLVGTMHLLSVLPIALASRRGLTPMAYAWFGGSLLRLAGTLAAGAVIHQVFDWPGRALAIGLAYFYCPLLAVEAVLVSRCLRGFRPGAAKDDGVAPSPDGDRCPAESGA